MEVKSKARGIVSTKPATMTGTAGRGIKKMAANWEKRKQKGYLH